jgi:hypothetical protein
VTLIAAANAVYGMSRTWDSVRVLQALVRNTAAVPSIDASDPPLSRTMVDRASAVRGHDPKDNRI